MDQTGPRPALQDRHAQGIHYQLSIRVRAHRPAHHAPRVQIQQHREMQCPAPRGDVCHVAGPHPVRRRRLEVAAEQVRRSRLAIARRIGCAEATHALGLDPMQTAQPCHTMPTNRLALRTQHLPRLVRGKSGDSIPITFGRPPH